MYFIILGVFSLIGMVVGNRLKSKFNMYSQMPIRVGLKWCRNSCKNVEALWHK
jgi:hypothetical protein